MTKKITRRKRAVKSRSPQKGNATSISAAEKKRRSAAAKRGWETRRAEEKKRARAAKKGWETRRAKQAAPKPPKAKRRKTPAERPEEPFFPAPPQTPEELAFWKRSQAAKAGWERRRERLAIQEEAAAEDFVPIDELPEDFGISIYEREAKYPNVARAVAVGHHFADFEFIDLANNRKDWTRERILRHELFLAYNEGKFNSRAREMAVEYATTLRELYELFFSPKAV